MSALTFTLGLLFGAAVACLWLGGLLRGRAEAEAAAYSDGFEAGQLDRGLEFNRSEVRWQG